MPDLKMRSTPGSAVVQIEPGGWSLSIPAGPPDQYRLAQIDDYLNLPRTRFCWQVPLRMEISARVSNQSHNGTWGFGFWNDPFNLSLGIGGASRRLPTLPNAAWFFFASPHNYLSFREDKPANGMLAGVFSAPLIPPLLLAPGLLGLPLLLTSQTSTIARRLLQKWISEDSKMLEENWTQWHKFTLIWKSQSLQFEIDGLRVFQTAVSPHGKLGLVIWIDNQFASFAPGKRFQSGSLATEQNCFLEIKDIHIE